MLLKIFGPNSKPYITKVRVSQGLAPDIVLWICAEKNNHNPFPDP